METNDDLLKLADVHHNMTPLVASRWYNLGLPRAGGGALSVAHYVPHEFVLFCCGMYIYIVCSPFRKKFIHGSTRTCASSRVRWLVRLLLGILQY